jgi:hypothetical protein
VRIKCSKIQCVISQFRKYDRETSIFPSVRETSLYLLHSCFHWFTISISEESLQNSQSTSQLRRTLFKFNLPTGLSNRLVEATRVFVKVVDACSDLLPAPSHALVIWLTILFFWMLEITITTTLTAVAPASQISHSRNISVTYLTGSVGPSGRAV